MTVTPVILGLIALVALAFLAVGVFIGSKLAGSKAAQQTAEIEKTVLAQHQQLQSELALAAQRSTALKDELGIAHRRQEELQQQLETQRNNAGELANSASALQEKLRAEQARTQDKVAQYDELQMQVRTNQDRIEELQATITDQRQQLGQSLEQTTQLKELKATHASLSSRYEQAQSELQQCREQLGQSVEQANQLAELKVKNLQLGEHLALMEGELRAQREQLGQASEQKQQMEELKAALTNIRTSYEQAQEQLKQQREQLGQAGEQKQQLEELKAALTSTRTSYEQAQEQLKQQREQLGQASEQKQQLEEARTRHTHLEQELTTLRRNLADAQANIAELNTAREKDQQAAEEKLQILQANKEQLKQEFQNLANQIFDTKQQSFSEQSRQGLDAMLKPFKEQLDSFRQRVDQVHSDTVQGQSAMKTELGKLMELNAQITAEASNLTRALKGDKKLQGTWGEQKVELLLEQAGLRKGFEYLREASFKNEDADNGRPDFIVNLPEDKHIIIDSKMSLVAYTDYVSAESEEQRAQALAAHVQALKNHIDGLASKKYPELNGMNSPDFVFLFMPIEPAYLVAAEHSPALFQAAYEKRIAIVTATTLLPVLRVVANLWSIQRQNQSTLQLAQQATRVYDKLRIFVEKMDKLGNQLNTVQKTYADSLNTLSGPHGSLTKTVDKFVDLGVKVVKRLPASAIADDDAPDVEPELLLAGEGSA